MDVIQDIGMNRIRTQTREQREGAGKHGTKVVKKNNMNMVNSTMKKKMIPDKKRLMQRVCYPWKTCSVYSHLNK